ncbi:PAS domain-containing sensor histidine kinase [Leptolyngbya sp. 'hensonii']|nr:PAS domain-containing sensor histidine kinase [Leptolyngbya sp. 'hensonii']
MVQRSLVEHTKQLAHLNGELERQMSERQRAEEALRQTEAKYQSIFENAVEGIFQTTPEGRFLNVNPALARMCGYASPELLMQQVTDIGQQLYVNPHRRTEFMAALQDHASVIGFESQIYRQDGEILWVSENTRAVRNEAGELLYYEGTVEDITDRKRSEQALRDSEAKLREQAFQLERTIEELKYTQSQFIQTEKMSSLGQLVAGMAHEINNPVNFIHGNLTHAIQYVEDLLGLVSLMQQEEDRLSPETQDFMADIDLDFILEDLPKLLTSMQMGTNRIRQIILSLRNFSRLDEADMKPVDLHEGLDSTLLILQSRLKPHAAFPGVTIVKEYGNLPPVACYAGQLNQVFMNILSNGIDALEESFHATPLSNRESVTMPTITIRTEIRSDRVFIRIGDNGPGIPEEVQRKLFDPFFTTKPIGKGTGLGLSISYQIVVEKHQGQLECFSSPGQGTEFVISIPLRK